MEGVARLSSQLNVRPVYEILVAGATLWASSSLMQVLKIIPAVSPACACVCTRIILHTMCTSISCADIGFSSLPHAEPLTW